MFGHVGCLFILWAKWWAQYFEIWYEISWDILPLKKQTYCFGKDIPTYSWSVPRNKAHHVLLNGVFILPCTWRTIVEHKLHFVKTWLTVIFVPFLACLIFTPDDTGGGLLIRIWASVSSSLVLSHISTAMTSLSSRTTKPQLQETLSDDPPQSHILLWTCAIKRVWSNIPYEI